MPLLAPTIITADQNSRLRQLRVRCCVNGSKRKHLAADAVSASVKKQKIKLRVCERCVAPALSLVAGVTELRQGLVQVVGQ